MRNILISLATAAVVSTAAVQAFAEKPASSPENYMRNSICSMLLVSPQQNEELEAEVKKVGQGAALIKSFVNRNANTSRVSEAPQLEFPTIPIPDQFNNHNLYYRSINFDSFHKVVNSADRSEIQSMVKSKKKAGSSAKSKIDADGPAAIWHMIKEFHYADSIVAKWFNYDPNAEQRWNLDLVRERGAYAATAEDFNMANASGMSSGLSHRIGMDLIPNTYILATNLRFRSNQAIVAETEAATRIVAGAVLGALFGKSGTELANSASTLIGAGTAAAAGEGFQVQAVTYLYKLEFDENAMNTFAEEIYAKNGTLQDLINLGICKMRYLGQEKAGSRVRQSITNKNSESNLIRRATTRAIDAAIARLQEKHESFRTSFPISECDANGMVYAKVGMKEGISKGDEYEILEMNEDPATGRTTWKKVGTVKAVDKKIWDNRAGAAEDVEDEANEDSKAKTKLSDSRKAVSLGHTAFSGAKKGADYTGYYLRLKKKK